MLQQCLSDCVLSDYMSQSLQENYMPITETFLPTAWLLAGGNAVLTRESVAINALRLLSLQNKPSDFTEQT